MCKEECGKYAYWCQGVKGYTARPEQESLLAGSTDDNKSSYRPAADRCNRRLIKPYFLQDKT